MTVAMPKDNEVDEKVMPVAWIVTNGGESCEPWLEYEQSEVDALPAVCIAEPLYSAATVAELRAEVERLVKALDEAACELSAAGQALAEFEGFEFRQKAAIDRAYAASQKAHDANGYTEALTGADPT